MIRVGRGALLLAACSWPAIAAGAAVDVVRLDGTSTRCTFVAATATLVTLDCEGRRTIGTDELTSLDFSAFRPQAPGDQTVFHLDDGGRLFGHMTGGGDERVTADLNIGEGVALPLSSLAGIWFARADSPVDWAARFDESLSDRLPGKDVLLFARDRQLNTIRGSVLSLGPQGGRLRFNDREFDFERSGLVGIVLATGLDRDRRWPVRVRLTDGTGFGGALVEGDGSRLVLDASFGSRVVVPVEDVARIEFDTDRVVYLSRLTPTRNESTGRLLLAADARFDRNVMNRPMSLDGRTYEKGIGVRARSVLEYHLGGAYESLAATIGIDDTVRPRGSVVFRVEGDGRELFDSGRLTGRDTPQPIVVDVRGVGQLSLIVDEADELDLSDHADWADARLIKPRGKE